MAKSKEYQPPFTITSKILSQVAEIAVLTGQLSGSNADSGSLRLRRINRIRTIQGSLAIEGNTLTEEQITTILEGEPVAAPLREIQEARNAIKTYDRFQQWRPWEKNDLAAAHQILMEGLIDTAGRYRTGGVGVMAGNKVLHMAPPANRVPALMNDLLRWLETCDHHPLITSSVFHYELEFIHPFEDGNGRMGRLWQTLILSRWNPLFSHVPVESLVHKHQQDYYATLIRSTRDSDSAPFIEFMLAMIRDALQILTGDQVGDQVSDQVARIIQALSEDELSSSALMNRLGLSHRPTFRKNYLTPALEGGWVERTQPNSPRSPTQRYRLTGKAGKRLKAQQKKT